jgi:serine/threonine protein kinase
MLERYATFASRYRVGTRIGVGGMGEVYLAFDEHLSRNVALKTVFFSDDGPQDAASRQAVLERFEREAKTLASLHHSHIVPIYDFGCTDDMPFLVMSYFDGEPLTRWGRKEKPTLAQWLHITSLLLGALSYAHGHGVLHRDIKPSNVLVRGPASAPELSLIDWGIALPTLTSRVTAAGQFVGTFGWVDPAILGNPYHPWTPQSDLYSVGVLLYLALCEKMPIEVPEDLPLAEKMECYTHGQPTPPIVHRPDLPADLNDFLLRLLQSDPAQRLASAAEAKLILDQMLQGEVTALDVAPTLHSINVDALTKPGLPLPVPNASAVSGESQRKSPMRRHAAAASIVTAIALAAVSIMLMWYDRDKVSALAPIRVEARPAMDITAVVAIAPAPLPRAAALAPSRDKLTHEAPVIAAAPLKPHRHSLPDDDDHIPRHTPR